MAIGDDPKLDRSIVSMRAQLDSLRVEAAWANVRLASLQSQIAACNDLVKELEVAMFQAASVPNFVDDWFGTPAADRALSTAKSANSAVINARNSAYAVLQRLYAQISEQQTLLNTLASAQQGLAADLQSSILLQSAPSAPTPVVAAPTLAPTYGGRF